MGLRILQGRDFMEGERDHPAIIVDRVTARKLWPNANPIGALLKLGDARADLPYVQVVGVVAPQDDPRTGAPFGERLLSSAAALGTMLYLPGPQDSAIARRNSRPMLNNVNFVARTRGGVSNMIVELRRAGNRWPDAQIRGIVSMSDYLGVSRVRGNTAFVSRAFMLFGALALAVGLAALSVYGVVAYAVAERRRELGVRIALGATSRDILHAVLRETVVLGLTGVALGLLLTKYGVPLLQAFALEEDFYNAPLFALLALTLLATTAVSALVPALRATRVDVTEALRAE